MKANVFRNVTILTLCAISLVLSFLVNRLLDKVSQLKSNNNKTKNSFKFIQKENQRLRLLYKQQRKEIAEYRVILGGWKGVGWYKLKLTTHNSPNGTGMPTSVRIGCFYLKSPPKPYWNNGLTSMRKAIVGFGPYSTKDECLAGQKASHQKVKRYVQNQSPLHLN